MQNYHEYLQTMRAYNFYPMRYALWASWQVHYHGSAARIVPNVSAGEVQT